MGCPIPIQTNFIANIYSENLWTRTVISEHWSMNGACIHFSMKHTFLSDSLLADKYLIWVCSWGLDLCII